MQVIEHFFNCPYCFEKISMLLDLSHGGQSYIEDCEVCCNPIEIIFQVSFKKIKGFAANKTQ